MNEIATQKLFRVQGGGTRQNRSRPFLRCDPNGNLEASASRNIYIGDMQHMPYFALKRLGLENIKDFNEDSKKCNVHIIEMIVPYWYTSLLEKYAIKQLNSHGKRLPKLVDRTTPGRSYSIRGDWTKLLKESCMHESYIKIESPEDLYNLVFSKQQYYMRELDYVLINELLKKCEINKEDIKNLNAMWGITQIESEESIL